MKISPNIALTPNSFDSLMDLAKSIDNCIYKEACYTILLSKDNYRTVYRETKILAFREKSLLLFIRSRIALFQMDFIWFQKETTALIDLWLDKEEQFQFYFSQISKNQLIQTLCFGVHEHSIGFVTFFKTEPTFDNAQLNQSLKDFLINLKADKLQLLEMAKVIL